MGNTASKINYNILSEYLEFVNQKKLCFKQNATEVEDIANAVQELVRRIVHEAGQHEERFSVSDIRFVGSMAEGTRILSPNEFDFLVILDKLSNGSNIKLVRHHHGGSSAVHIKIDPTDEDTASTWKDICVNGKLKSTKSGFFKKGFREKYLSVLRKAATTLLEKQEHRIEKATGVLEIGDRFEQHGPACSCGFLWTLNNQTETHSEKLNVSVDITPAIKCMDVDFINVEDIQSELLYQKIKDAGEFMVISCGKKECSQCFKLTFTTIELDLLKGLSEKHIKCYKLLKYLFNNQSNKCDTKDVIFHSYLLKTFVLKHAFSETCAEKGLGFCVLEVLEDIQHCLKSRLHVCCSEDFRLVLPYFILKRSNIFKNDTERNRYEHCKKGIRWMKKYLQNISSSKFSCDYENRMMEFENMYVLTLPSAIHRQNIKELVSDCSKLTVYVLTIIGVIIMYTCIAVSKIRYDDNITSLQVPSFDKNPTYNVTEY